MTGSLGVVGDLCKEVDWMTRRLKKVKLSLSSCCHPGLETRLRREADGYELRCRQILEMLSTPGSLKLPFEGPQVSLLSELLTRSLRQNCVL